MIARRILLALLSLSLLLEAVLTVRGFTDPVWLNAQFGGSSTNSLPIAISIVSWFLLLVSGLIAISIYQNVKSNRADQTIALSLAIWWMALGVGLYLQFGITTNLITDSLKGLLISVTVLWMRKSVRS